MVADTDLSELLRKTQETSRDKGTRTSCARSTVSDGVVKEDCTSARAVNPLLLLTFSDPLKLVTFFTHSMFTRLSL